jgi:hypothetical protein
MAKKIGTENNILQQLTAAGASKNEVAFLFLLARRAKRLGIDEAGIDALEAAMSIEGLSGTTDLETLKAALQAEGVTI